MEKWGTVLFSDSNKTRNCKFQTVNIPRGVPVPISVCGFLEARVFLLERKKEIKSLLEDDHKLYGSSDSYIDSLKRSVKTVSGDMGMEFHIDKCEMLKMEREKSTMSRN